MKREITRTGNSAPVHQFTVLLSPTPRGARLARRLAVAHLASWGLPYETAAHLVAELAANAAVHGHEPGKDFRLGLSVDADATLRIEVSDTRDGGLPVGPGEWPVAVGEEAESGRGLLLVQALADRWGVKPGPPLRKTVWAEVSCAG
ncbi:MAG TPA: hypothetical protein DEQ61_16475 [Streptomyces sp.]|nr:hypothetical protein [Streptomyces sp.]